MFFPPRQISRWPSISGAIRPPSTRPASKISALCPAAASASAAAKPPRRGPAPASAWPAAKPAMPPPTTATLILWSPFALIGSDVRDLHGALAADLAALRAADPAAAAVLVEHDRAHHVGLELGELLEAHVEAADRHPGVVHPELL